MWQLLGVSCLDSTLLYEKMVYAVIKGLIIFTHVYSSCLWWTHRRIHPNGTSCLYEGSDVEWNRCPSLKNKKSPHGFLFSFPCADLQHILLPYSFLIIFYLLKHGTTVIARSCLMIARTAKDWFSNSSLSQPGLFLSFNKVWTIGILTTPPLQLDLILNKVEESYDMEIWVQRYSCWILWDLDQFIQLACGVHSQIRSCLYRNNSSIYLSWLLNCWWCDK